MLLNKAARKNPEFWGRAAAGIFFTCMEDNTAFLMHRSEFVQEPGTWGIPGGSVSGEALYDSEIDVQRPTDGVFWEGAQQEVIEECGGLPEGVTLIGSVDFVEGNFVYRNFVCDISKESKARWTKSIRLNWENDAYGWFNLDDLEADLPYDELHFGVENLLEEL